MEMVGLKDRRVEEVPYTPGWVEFSSRSVYKNVIEFYNNIMDTFKTAADD